MVIYGLTEKYADLIITIYARKQGKSINKNDRAISPSNTHSGVVSG